MDAKTEHSGKRELLLKKLQIKEAEARLVIARLLMLQLRQAANIWKPPRAA